jgi:hypothetical protein
MFCNDWEEEGSEYTLEMNRGFQALKDARKDGRLPLLGNGIGNPPSQVGAHDRLDSNHSID